MAKYYKLFLNCARVKEIGTVIKDYGFIKILPLKGTVAKRSLFGIKYEPITEYEGSFLVIAEQIDDHFEDIVLRRKIYLDPNGLKDITIASFDELMSNLKFGLTCYYAMEIESEVAIYYKNIIESDINIFNKYKSELAEIAGKKNIINELVNRLDLESCNKSKKRVLNIKNT